MKAAIKRKELENLVAGKLQPIVGNEASQIAIGILHHFATITPPEESSQLKLITIRPGGHRGGSSTKPGNVTLNMRKLVIAIASGILTIVGAFAAPWTLVLGALVTWDSLWSCLQLNLSEIEASVLWTLWKNRGEDDTVAKVQVLDAVNRERGHFGKRSLSEREVEDSLEDLQRMGCIEEPANDNSRWWLREWVIIEYQ